MNKTTKQYEEAIKLIDEQNSQDPNQEQWQEENFPKELLYSIRMSECLEKFAPDASEVLKLAARAQHICRWKKKREEFPMDRKGYLHWRNQLKIMHAEVTQGILKSVDYPSDVIDQVCNLIEKKNLKQNQDTQILEDVVCLVFLQFYLADFSKKKDEEKIIDILRKTWRKMSQRGQSEALSMDLPEKTIYLIQQAVT
ncbi:MAG: DUF4202 domain-containing protein [Saprospiraceae bacterium]|nr:DUF4202 domain-containing protein [Saprospiraceae bacterium]